MPLSETDIEALAEQVERMSREQREQRKAEIIAERARLEGIADGGRGLTQAQRAHLEALTQEHSAIQAAGAREDITRARTLERIRGGGGGGELRTEAGTPYGQDGYRPSFGGLQLRDQAMRTVEDAMRSRGLPQYAADRVDALLRHGTQLGRDMTARWAVATGDEAYRSCFAKLLADPVRGHLLWTAEEGEAYRRVAEVQSEMRGMSLTDNAGGYMVPFTLDPAIMLTSDGSINPLRRISRVVQTATDTWNGVTSAGVTAEWTAEGAEVADASPILAQPSIPVHKGDAFVKYSFEVGQDAINFLAELQGLLNDAADQLQATAYTTGSGSGQPTGIVTALAGTSSEINSGGTEALLADDPYTLQNALPPRFSARAQWCANLSIINTLRQFETTNGALKFPELASNPPMLLGRAMNENSNMDGLINAAATENNYALLYGDFQQFVIVDRIGSTLELIPNLVGANRRPTGERGAMLWYRTGSDVVIDNGFRMLDVPTTA